MIRRMIAGFVEAQQGWADPFGEASQKVLGAILRPVPPLKNFLHGTWLGHAVHPTLTDVPVGAFTGALLLDVLDLLGRGVFHGATLALIALGLLVMLAAIVTGYADYTDTDTKPARGYATVHSLAMLVVFVLYLVSLVIRLGEPSGARVSGGAFGFALVGWLLLAFGAYLGGELVLGMGNMVDHHAFRSFSEKWQPLSALPNEDGKPVQAKAGAQTLVLVRKGQTVYALHDICSHAGCNLSDGGTVVDGAIQCPCHGSRFDLATGRVVNGPATYDQPVYDVRVVDGKAEALRRTTPEKS